MGTHWTVEATTPRMRHARAARGIVWQYAGGRTPETIAALVAARTGQTPSPAAVRHAMWTYHAAPTKDQGWLTTTQAARRIGCSVQWVSHLCRTGAIAAHRNPGGAWWLIGVPALAAYLAQRHTGTITGRYFITPHAVLRFQQRVADLPYERARLALAQLLEMDWPSEPGRNAQVLRVRWQGWQFGVVVTAAEMSADQPLPLVKTVL
jgi:hypothetical protein